MKAFIIVLVVVAVLGVGGVMGYRYLSSKGAGQTAGTPQTQNSTLTGRVMPGKGDDYSYVLLDAKGKTTGIVSQTLDLSVFVRKNVEVTGSFSGTTLYVYTITEK